MKRKFMAVLLMSVLVLSLAACGGGESGSDTSEKQEIKEYDIEIFGKTYEETRSLFDEETKYLTEEEINSQKGADIWAKCSEQTGLPLNEEIILRGKKNQFIDHICIKSEDEQYIIFCMFPELPKQNVSLFVEDDSNVVVKGIFSKKGAPYGMLSDTTFVSPSEIDASYKGNNVADVLSEFRDSNERIDAIVYGEITDILPIEEFKESLSGRIDEAGYYYDTVARIDDPENGTIYFSFNENYTVDMHIGDKVATQGTLEVVVDFDSPSDGYMALCAFIDRAEHCYNFSTQE